METAAIERTIPDSIEWAIPDKNIELLFGTVADDPDLFIYHPDSGSTILGRAAFGLMVEQVFLDDAFRAVKSEIKDLRVHLSDCGHVAWFSCLLDDLGEWKGQPIVWIDCRWTGVLEKKGGRWVIMQMHFSLVSDAHQS